MSADLNTFIELEGTLEEVKSMIAVIKDYCGHDHDASLEFPRISSKKKFDGKNDFLLESLTEDSLEAFFTKCKKKFSFYAKIYLSLVNKKISKKILQFLLRKNSFSLEIFNCKCYNANVSYIIVILWAIISPNTILRSMIFYVNKSLLSFK